MPKIAISYRRTESDATGRIYDRLVQRYGEESIFRDIDTIPFGADFRKAVDEALADVDALIAIVGPQWRGINEDGSARITEENDLVRIEIETALKRGIPLIPVLIGSAIMPKATELPESIRDFSFRNAATIDSGRNFNNDIERVMRSIDRYLEAKKKREAEGKREAGLKEEAEKEQKRLEEEERRKTAEAQQRRADKERCEIAEAKRRAEEERARKEAERKEKERREKEEREPQACELENRKRLEPKEEGERTIPEHVPIWKLVLVPWKSIQARREASMLKGIGAIGIALAAVFWLILSFVAIVSHDPDRVFVTIMFLVLAVLYGACALGTYLEYRSAAVAGFVLTIPFGLYVITIPVVLAVYAGIRGTFAMRRLRKPAAGIAPAS
jgi:hypothetical protein